MTLPPPCRPGGGGGGGRVGGEGGFRGGAGVGQGIWAETNWVATSEFNGVYPTMNLLSWDGTWGEVCGHQGAAMGRMSG
jgi:hypothetical protein